MTTGTPLEDHPRHARPEGAFPETAVVVTPRERFSAVRESLESVLACTPEPHRMVVVDGGSPARVRDWLRDQSRRRDFTLVRTERYLTPNQGRNLGLAACEPSRYVVFIDNDVVVTPGWLSALVRCAEETGAAVVTPLICEQLPLHTFIHCAGGEIGIRVKETPTGPTRHVHERIQFQGKRVAEVRDRLKREETTFAEFHCVLVRRDMLDRLGPFDEGMLSTREHIDFCLGVMAAGGKMVLEPESLMTYVPGPPLERTDLPYFMLRWSDAWELESLRHFRDKWDLAEDGFFLSRIRNRGLRRRMTLVRPLSRRLTGGRHVKSVEEVLVRLDRALNKLVVRRYAPRPVRGTVDTPVPR